MIFDRARAVADAVLLEGYVLYPYRVTSNKNRFRWAFGIVAPQPWSEDGGCESYWMQTQCLAELGPDGRLAGRLRFMQARRRQVEEPVDGDGAFRPVESLDVDGHLYLPWDEGDVREIDLDDLGGSLDAGEMIIPFEVDGGVSDEILRDDAGVVRGRIRRQSQPIEGRVRVRAETVDAPHRLIRLTVRVENTTPWRGVDTTRDDMLRRSCIATHLLFSVTDGAFVSLLDPPPWAELAATECKSERCYPVLVGDSGRRDLVLASPIILYDHPRVAPESPGDSFDACEIDEILTLRTMTLTDEEKRQARATDPRAAAVVDRADSLPPEMRERLHGAIRELERAEMVPRDRPGSGLRPGCRVRLRPGARRTDAQDALLVGCVATVEALLRDVDDRDYLAVTIDDDPAADLHRWYGRFHYFYPDEVELVDEEGPWAR